MKLVLVIALLLSCFAKGQEAVVPEKEDQARPRTVSMSRQFVINGSELAIRSRLASLAEEVRRALIKVAGEGPVDKETGKADWQHSIVIQLQGQPGDPEPAPLMNSHFSILDDGFSLQLKLHLARGIDRDVLERKLLELLIYERGLRDQNPQTISRRISVPAWLIEGLLESIRWGRQEGDRDLYRVLFERNAVFPVGELLGQTEVEKMDGVTRTTFRVSAGAMVMALLKQDGGVEAMEGLLADAATFEGDPLALLRKNFPGMNLGPESLTKWWALQLASMSVPSLLDTMTILESEEALEELLQLKVFRGGDVGNVIEIAPAQYRDLLALPLPERRQALQPVFDGANKLHYRVFPAYRPILVGYLEVLSDLAGEKDENVEERLAALKSGRKEYSQAGELLADYISWYQITTSKDVSGAFSDYVELRRRLEEERTKRSGPVSKYLDRMEAFQKR